MYKIVRSSGTKHLDFLIVDVVCLQLAFILAYVVRNGWVSPYSIPSYQRVGALLILAQICIVFFNESYKGILRRGLLQELKATIKHVTQVEVMVVIVLFFFQMSAVYSRIVFLIMWIIGCVLSYSSRLCLKCYIGYRAKNGHHLRSVVLVTTKDAVEAVMNTVGQHLYSGFQITGIAIIDFDQRGKEFAGIPVVARGEDVLDYIKCNIVDEVFIHLPGETNLSNDLMESCIMMGTTVHKSLYGLSKDMENKTIQNFGGYTVLSKSIKMATPKQLFFKRLLDITGGLVGMVITAVATIFVAPVIYAQSPGPIFFSQERVGKNGRRFRIYKFRSMYMDAEERKKDLMAQNEMNGLMFKMKNDPRIFPFGAVMRKTSIDELPQFWNVLKGDMSLVGTRPPTVDEYVQYEIHHKSRLATKPGITGMWQVSGRSDITDFEEVVALDREYIENWTIGLDVKMLWKTAGVVLKRSGSV